jgi:hypothetical protein
MESNKSIVGFSLFAIILQSAVSIGLLSTFLELTVLTELNNYGFGNIINDYPRYF